VGGADETNLDNAARTVSARERAIADLLVHRGTAHMHERAALFPFTGIHRADVLLNDLEQTPHAFVTACVMDRQIRAELSWQIPLKLQERLGTFRFAALAALSYDDVMKAFAKPSPLHRFTKTMARCFFEAIRHIGDEYGGDASKMWKGKPSSALVVYRFLKLRGVGPKIATMAVNILARNFKIRFADYYSVDISADAQVRRVFERLGLTTKGATEQELIYKARALNPEFPGLLDWPTWDIGRKWCRPRRPQCESCYMQSICPWPNS
jgi:uncharacterized HhH-GPD family protein